jgi:hypothetical protein
MSFASPEGLKKEKTEKIRVFETTHVLVKFCGLSLG